MDISPIAQTHTTKSAAPEAVLSAHVLVADVDGEAPRVYGLALGLMEAQLTHVQDGREALVKALETRFSLIITETNLPYIDGFSLCEILRSDALTKTVPLVVITADPRPSSLERALRAGADAAFVKPFDPETLCAEVRRLDERRRGAESIAVATTVLDAPSSPPIGELDPRREDRVRRIKNRKLRRYQTRVPPLEPPAIRCPSCDRALTYEGSQIGGVPSAREQWDYYRCRGGCATFQYRHRTRKLRQV
jgi:DNA-binding response OmpR family regulator